MKRKSFSPTLLKILPPIFSFIVGAIVSTAVGELLLTPVFKSKFFNLIAFIAIFICLAIIAILMYVLIEYINELKDRIGFKVTYFEYKPGDRTKLFSQLKRLIGSSKESILVLTYLSDLATDDLTVEEGKVREEYYKSILEQVPKGVRYERVLQIDIDDRQNNLSTLKLLKNNKFYLKHFHEIVDLMDNPRYNSNLRIYKASASLLASFMIVDKKYLILEIDEVLKTGQNNIYGVFVIEDPREEITRYFENFFNDILKTRGRGLVQKNELPSIN